MRRAQTKTMKVALIPKPINVVTRFSPDPSISPPPPSLPAPAAATRTPPPPRSRRRLPETHARRIKQRESAAAVSCAAYKSDAAGGWGHRRGVWDLRGPLARNEARGGSWNPGVGERGPGTWRNKYLLVASRLLLLP
jgi:hypothetical protein